MLVAKGSGHLMDVQLTHLCILPGGLTVDVEFETILFLAGMHALYDQHTAHLQQNLHECTTSCSAPGDAVQD